MAVKAYTAPGDAVLIQSPVYYPFSEVIADNGRRVVSSTLVLGDDNRYHMDVADFEEKLKAENVKLFSSAIRTTRSEESGRKRS